MKDSSYANDILIPAENLFSVIFNQFKTTSNYQSDRMTNSKRKSASHSVLSDSLRPHALEAARLLCPWDSLGKNTGVGCHSLFQGIFLTQGFNLGILH